MIRAFRLGLTGSIGMGKSTTAAMFADLGCSVWDADAAVHRIYSRGGAAVEPIRSLYTDAIVDGAVSRDRLKDWIAKDPAALRLIEAVVHPLVAEDRRAHAEATAADIVVFDIPLLFETGSEDWFDAVAVVTAPPEIQKARVLARPGMTQDQFDTILARQMTDAEKRNRADYIIETETLDAARQMVEDIVKKIRAGRDNAGSRTGHGNDGV